MFCWWKRRKPETRLPLNPIDPSKIPALKLEPGLADDEILLLNSPLPRGLPDDEAAKAWEAYQTVIGRFLVRMGTDSKLLDYMARAALVGSLDGVFTRLALIPKLSTSALHAIGEHGVSELLARMLGECSLMELSAAAGYRTFCFPDLIKGLLKTGKMRNSPVQRMMDTFEFLNTMVQRPYNDPRVAEQLARTNGLHARYKVAGAHNPAARDLFKYIALNMFYIGPRMRPDITPAERHAICGLTVLVSEKMGHAIDGSVKDLEAFIDDYEASEMFSREDDGILRRRAVEIAQASKAALDKIPTISPARIHAHVPYRVKKILQID